METPALVTALLALRDRDRPICHLGMSNIPDVAFPALTQQQVRLTPSSGFYALIVWGLDFGEVTVAGVFDLDIIYQGNYQFSSRLSAMEEEDGIALWDVVQSQRPLNLALTNRAAVAHAIRLRLRYLIVDNEADMRLVDGAIRGYFNAVGGSLSPYAEPAPTAGPIAAPAPRRGTVTRRSSPGGPG